MNNKQNYINILKSTKRDGIEKLIAWLETETDFFTAPCSTIYHSNYEGGLLQHSLNVYKSLITLDYDNSLYIDLDTIIITSLLHDICKVNTYEKSIKNVVDGYKTDWKGNKVKNWVEKEVYTFNDLFPLGHAEKSIILIQRFIKLSVLEIVMIRWHMGGFESKDNYKYLSTAFDNYKEVVALHLADMMATYFMEQKEN